MQKTQQKRKAYKNVSFFISFHLFPFCCLFKTLKHTKLQKKYKNVPFLAPQKEILQKVTILLTCLFSRICVAFLLFIRELSYNFVVFNHLFFFYQVFKAVSFPFSCFSSFLKKRYKYPKSSILKYLQVWKDTQNIMP